MEQGENTTTDLADFGRNEIYGAIELLEMWMKHGLPDDFEEDEVRVMFNPKSGFVFLTNSEYQVAAMHGDNLESFYTCFKCGNEGFKDQFEKDAVCEECQRIAGVDEEEETEEESG